MRAKPSLALTSVLLALAALSSPADAACKKFGFTVNDYGKEGPTNDAKNLLDKHISEWAAQNGVSAYQTGKKSVSCELFLDVVLFDEHTCTASATVCWGDGVKPNNKPGQQSAAAEATATESGDQPPAPMRKAEAMGVAPQQAATAPAAEAATPATAAADQAPPAAPAAPVEQAVAPAETPPAIPAVQTTAPAAPTPPPTGAAVETGALQAGAGMTAVSKSAPGVPEKDRAAAAAAAASAAAAAERAAVAAETAANAAKEAAAAAVAASAASKGTTSVPPLDHASTGGKPPHNE